MAVPGDRDAREYYRSASKRLEEARVLLREGHGTGAVYLAGYGVECILKALLLASAREADRAELLGGFRGPAGHDIAGLLRRYRAWGGAGVPRELMAKFTVADEWTTSLRYSPREVPRKRAEKFLDAVSDIITWADRRIS